MEDHPGRVEDRASSPLRSGSANAVEADADLGRQRLDAGRRLAGRQPRAFVGDDLARHGGQRVGIGRPSGSRGRTAASSRSTLGGRGRSGDIVPSVAGTRGSRTHRAAPSAAPLVLKTRGPTGTRPLPARW